MVRRREHRAEAAAGGRRPWDWEPWEARRAARPRRPTSEVREVRQDAQLLLGVVRARLQEGAVPVEHLPALDRVAADERVQVRRRRGAAELAARIRLAAVGQGSPQGPQGAP